MAYQVPGFKVGFLVADADLSAKQFYAVKLTTAGKVGLAGAGERCIGILQNNPVANEAAEIDCDGVSKAIAGGNITYGSELASDANGKLVAATTGDYVIAVALSAGAAGDIIPVKLVSYKI